MDGVPNKDEASIEGEHSSSSSGDGCRVIFTEHNDIIGRCAVMVQEKGSAIGEHVIRGARVDECVGCILAAAANNIFRFGFKS